RDLRAYVARVRGTEAETPGTHPPRLGTRRVLDVRRLSKPKVPPAESAQLRRLPRGTGGSRAVLGPRPQTEKKRTFRGASLLIANEIFRDGRFWLGTARCARTSEFPIAAASQSRHPTLSCCTFNRTIARYAMVVRVAGIDRAGASRIYALRLRCTSSISPAIANSIHGAGSGAALGVKRSVNVLWTAWSSASPSVRLRS